MSYQNEVQAGEIEKLIPSASLPVQLESANKNTLFAPRTKLVIAATVALILSFFCYARYIDPSVIDYAMNPIEFLSNVKDTICAPNGKKKVI